MIQSVRLHVATIKFFIFIAGFFKTGLVKIALKNEKVQSFTFINVFLATKSQTSALFFYPTSC